MDIVEILNKKPLWLLKGNRFFFVDKHSLSIFELDKNEIGDMINLEIENNSFYEKMSIVEVCLLVSYRKRFLKLG